MRANNVAGRASVRLPWLMSLPLPRTSRSGQRQGMVENRPLLAVFSHLILIAGVAIIALPLYIGFVGSTLSFDQVTSVPMQMTPGTHLVENYSRVLTSGSTMASGAPVGRMMWNSLVMALCIAIGKIAISLLSAFAIVYFRFPLRYTFFWMIFVTLMLPVEVRILPTYKVVAELGMVNTYWGLTLFANLTFSRIPIPPNMGSGRGHR